MKQVNVKINNAEGKLVKEFNIKRLTIKSNAKRLKFNSDILKLELDDYAKNNLFTCAALAITLHDKKGDCIYDEIESITEIEDKMEEDLGLEIFDILCKAYQDINPLEPTLKAKKKKS